MSKVKIYASGSGALSFVRVDDKNIACEPHKISMQEARQAMIDSKNPYEGFDLIEHYGEPLLIPHVVRNRETNVHFYDGNSFMKISGHWFVEHLGEWIALRNYSMLAALKFHEENPSLYVKEKRA